MVLFRVKNKKHYQSVETLTDPPCKFNSAPLLSFKSLICRTCLYPMSCFLAHFGSNVCRIYYILFRTRPAVLLYWGRFGYCSRGLLHLFSFLADPMVIRAIPKLSNAAPKEAGYSRSSFHINLSSGSDYSYENIIEPLLAENASTSLEKVLIDFQKFI
ncbi:hypothetical protein DSO57_1025190 [Entomophthora muscae]|uniref:Uncharacterized protein n=1 Tax=Entomophthora muscae TaxID=34485 RepID=A0ACC2UD95_9FUNG|nr:hypothetical protein DSO57_1025190 [Entomophthora muscae]